MHVLEFRLQHLGNRSLTSDEFPREYLYNQKVVPVLKRIKPHKNLRQHHRSEPRSNSHKQGPGQLDLFQESVQLHTADQILYISAGTTLDIGTFIE